MFLIKMAASIICEGQYTTSTTMNGIPLFCIGCGDFEWIKKASSKTHFPLREPVITDEIKKSGKFQGDINELCVVQNCVHNLLSCLWENKWNL